MTEMLHKKQYSNERGSAFVYVILCIFFLAGIIALQLSVPSEVPAPHSNLPPQRTTQKSKDITIAEKKPQPIATTSIIFTETTVPSIVPAPRAVPLSTNPHIQKKIVTPTPIPIQIPLVPFETINTEARKAIVNIICTAKNSGVFMPVSGSGVIIDPRGVILTNAHIANIFLLKDYPSEGFVECVVRSGSPAYNMYQAELLYISSTWIKTNKNSIAEENPTGTGENDFALLRITQTISGVDPLPEKFSFIPYELEENGVEEGQSVLVVGYPASFLGGITIQKDLHITSTISKITKLYTFDQGGLVDLISVGTSILSQKGSSGGAVVRQISNKLTGLIVTSTSGETTGERELNAITISHVNRSIKNEMKLDLQAFLNADITLTAHDFQKIVAPSLTKILIDAVEAK